MNQMFNQPQMYQNPYTNRYAPSNGIIWVQGIEGAKAYQLQPNSNAILMDSEIDGRFYIKTCDSVGMCTLRKFTYTECLESEDKPIDLSGYVTKQELDNAIAKIMGELNNEQTVSANEYTKRRRPIIEE